MFDDLAVPGSVRRDAETKTRVKDLRAALACENRAARVSRRQACLPADE